MRDKKEWSEIEIEVTDSAVKERSLHCAPLVRAVTIACLQFAVTNPCTSGIQLLFPHRQRAGVVKALRSPFRF